jgi:hypothetical protein
LRSSVKVLPRVAAAIGLAAGVLVGAAGSASAANTVNFTSPNDGATVTELPTIAGTVHLDGGCITKITLAANGPENTPIANNEIAGSGGGDQEFSWPHPDLLANGHYNATADVSFQGICGADFTNSSLHTERNFVLNAPPAAPTGLKLGSGARRTVPLSWGANKEADLQGYRVYRTPQKTGCKAPASEDPGWDVKDPTYTDSSLPAAGGTFCYFVRGWRYDIDGKTPLASGPSTAVAATVPEASSSSTGGGSTGTTTAGNGSDGNFNASAGDPTTAGQPDVNGFGAALDRNQRGGPARAPGQTGSPATQRDTGFKETLPFGQAASPAEQEDGADDPNSDQAAAANGNPDESALSIHASNNNSSKVKTLGTFAGGLIVTVILGHVLLLRREVNKGPASDPIG